MRGASSRERSRVFSGTRVLSGSSMHSFASLRGPAPAKAHTKMKTSTVAIVCEGRFVNGALRPAAAARFAELCARGAGSRDVVLRCRDKSLSLGARCEDL